MMRVQARALACRSVALTAAIFVAAKLAFAGRADDVLQKPSLPAIAPSRSVPSKIVTTDGTVYQSVKLIRVEPDGLLIQYQPQAGGIGLANLKFAKLPEPLQKQFGYDPLKASAFEQEEAQAATALAQKLRRADMIRRAVSDNLSERPNLVGTVSVNCSDPTVTYAYYPPGQKPVEVGEHTGVTEPHFTCQAQVTFDAQRGAYGKPVRLSIATVTFSLGLSCHIIEPEHPYEFVSRHEEGHRRICEYFYRFAPQVAQCIGKAMIGRTFDTDTTSVDAARKQILPQAQSLAQAEYQLRLFGPAMAANRFYDQLNDPEGKHIDVDKAVQEAIARYRKQINLQPKLLINPPSSTGRSTVLPPGFSAANSPAD